MYCYCKNCNFKAKLGEKYCRNCGKKIIDNKVKSLGILYSLPAFFLLTFLVFLIIISPLVWFADGISAANTGGESGFLRIYVPFILLILGIGIIVVLIGIAIVLIELKKKIKNNIIFTILMYVIIILSIAISFQFLINDIFVLDDFNDILKLLLNRLPIFILINSIPVIIEVLDYILKRNKIKKD